MSEIQGPLIILLSSFAFWIGMLPFGKIRALIALPFIAAAVALSVSNRPVTVSGDVRKPLELIALASMISALYFNYRRLRAAPKA